VPQPWVLQPVLGQEQEQQLVLGVVSKNVMVLAHGRPLACYPSRAASPAVPAIACLYPVPSLASS
jgi:hypothetical protein